MILIITSIICISYVLVNIAGCANASVQAKEASTVDTIPDIEDFKKIDFHTHYRHDRMFLDSVLRVYNMQALNVDVVKEIRGVERRNWDAYKSIRDKHPSLFFLCSGFKGTGIDHPDYTQKVIKRLEQDIAEGAQMVKVWKNFGMIDKDNNGAFIQIDDDRLKPIWDFCVTNNLPVIAHIAEPVQAWLPIDTMNPHHGYFRSHPQYHAYLHPEIPRYETIIQARDNWIEKNPDLTIIMAHLGSMAHDVDEVAARLDKYPNTYAEPGARFGDLVRQDSRKVRDFIIKYQDRFIYGTDLGIWDSGDDIAPEAVERSKKIITDRLNLHWEYLTSADSIQFDSWNLPRVYPTKGLDLPLDVLQKVYYDNAAKLLNIK